MDNNFYIKSLIRTLKEFDLYNAKNSILLKKSIERIPLELPHVYFENLIHYCIELKNSFYQQLLSYYIDIIISRYVYDVQNYLTNEKLIKNQIDVNKLTDKIKNFHLYSYLYTKFHIFDVTEKEMKTYFYYG